MSELNVEYTIRFAGDGDNRNIFRLNVIHALFRPLSVSSGPKAFRGNGITSLQLFFKLNLDSRTAKV